MQEFQSLDVWNTSVQNRAVYISDDIGIEIKASKTSPAILGNCTARFSLAALI
jgi:hypothetical protein